MEKSVENVDNGLSHAVSGIFDRFFYVDLFVCTGYITLFFSPYILVGLSKKSLYSVIFGGTIFFVDML